MKLAETKTGAEFDTNIGKALEAYTKAIELKPDDPASHNNYALALAKAKKFPEMQAELKKAADLDPANGGKYYYNLGAILVNSGQNDAAGEAFKKAIELTPTYADAYYQYGVTLVGKAQIGGGRQGDTGSGHGRGLPEVSGIAAQRAIRPAGQGHVDDVGFYRGHQVPEPQRQERHAGDYQEEEVGFANRGGEPEAAAPIPPCVSLFVRILFPLLVFWLVRSVLKSLFASSSNRVPAKPGQ